MYAVIKTGGKQQKVKAGDVIEVEKIVHDPEAPSAPKPEIPESIMETLRPQFTEEVAALQEFAGHEFPGWKRY